jgi:hypothetical protein
MTRGLALANAVALLLALIWLALMTLPMTQAVRVRNAFLLRRGRPEDFTWTPSVTPLDFRAERLAAPAVIAAAVEAIGMRREDGDWARACALVGMLVRHAQHEGGIGADLAGTFEGIVSGHGYCSDYVRVYMAAARCADLFCRQWAFSFDGFGGHGHTFVEIYDRQRAAWVFVDVHNNVYAALVGNDAPLDALSLRQALIGAPSAIEFRRAAPGRLGFPQPEKLRDYYRRGAGEWYLWWGNDVIAREQRGLIGALGVVSGRLAHWAGSAFGGVPPLVVLATSENERAIARMEALRRRVAWGALASALLGIGLCAQLAWTMLGRGHV